MPTTLILGWKSARNRARNLLALILPLKFGVNDFYGALQTRNIKAYRAAQLALDICHPRQIENAAHEILSTLVSMIGRLQMEIAQYPDIELTSIRVCCKALKGSEENADLIYHEWRKKQRRVLVLSLIEENNWTEILGVLEQTTDAAYHTGLLLERIARYRQK